MDHKKKLSKEQMNAQHIADMTRPFFDELSRTEQKVRLAAIKNLRIRNRKTSKRSSTPASLKVRSVASAKRTSTTSPRKRQRQRRDTV